MVKDFGESISPVQDLKKHNYMHIAVVKQILTAWVYLDFLTRGMVALAMLGR